MPENTWTSTTRYVPHPARRTPTGRPSLTPEQQQLAEDLETRALALRAASEDGLSIREAIDMAAVQLGLESSQVTTSEGDER